MTHLDTLFPQEHAIIQNDHLKCIYLLLKTIWNLFIGDVKQAIVTLSSTHRLLEGDTNILSNGYLEVTSFFFDSIFILVHHQFLI